MSGKRKKGGGTVSLQDRTDIPYSQRLSLMKKAAVDAHRNDAATVGAKIALVALNDVFGIGEERGARFAKRYMELDRAFYADRETEEHHLDERLKKIGYLLDERGHVLGVEDKDGNVRSASEYKKAAAEVEENANR